jgi:hypothetical protein
MSAANRIDEESGRDFVGHWRKKCSKKGLNVAQLETEFEKHKLALVKGEDLGEVSPEFDDWLRRVDTFPYCALQNRKWQALGPCEVLGFFRKHHRPEMWPVCGTAYAAFFNYCKLAINQSDGPLADEVNAAEGLTRFFAGTAVACQVSFFVLLVAVVEVVAVVVLSITGQAGFLHPQALVLGSCYGAFAVVSVLILWLIRHWIVRRFRRIRIRETETVYQAFYLHETRGK